MCTSYSYYLSHVPNGASSCVCHSQCTTAQWPRKKELKLLGGEKQRQQQQMHKDRTNYQCMSAAPPPAPIDSLRRRRRRRILDSTAPIAAIDTDTDTNIR